MRNRGAAVVLAGLAAAAPAVADQAAVRACAEGARAGGVGACERALEATPDEPTLLRLLARARVAAADFDGAIESYRALSLASPDDADAQYMLAGTLGFVRRYQEALAPIEAALRLEPEWLAAHRAAALLYAHAGKPEEAARATLASAERGEITAMYDLYLFYRDGIGVAADFARARHWAERAAEAGHLRAVSLMVRVYREGMLGAIPDEARARAWEDRARAEENER